MFSDIYDVEVYGKSVISSEKLEELSFIEPLHKLVEAIEKEIDLNKYKIHVGQSHIAVIDIGINENVFRMLEKSAR